MNRMFLAGAALAAAISTGGCLQRGPTASVGTVALAAVAEPPDTSAASWQMPWQISPATSASKAQGEETVLAYVPNTGYVRGRPEVVASIGTPMTPAPGTNRTVEACRDVVESEASKIGAREVEAASAGPHRRNRRGHYEGPVRMRITYATSNGFEVREATMTCIVDARGKIVDAKAG